MPFLKWLKKQVIRDDEIGDLSIMYVAHTKKHADYPIHKPQTMKLFKAMEDAPNPEALKKAIIEYKAYTNIARAHRQYLKAFSIPEIPIEEVKENELRPK